VLGYNQFLYIADIPNDFLGKLYIRNFLLKEKEEIVMREEGRVFGKCRFG
jgi:hypothetical protein